MSLRKYLQTVALVLALSGAAAAEDNGDLGPIKVPTLTAASRPVAGS